MMACLLPWGKKVQCSLVKESSDDGSVRTRNPVKIEEGRLTTTVVPSCSKISPTICYINCWLVKWIAFFSALFQLVILANSYSKQTCEEIAVYVARITPVICISQRFEALSSKLEYISFGACVRRVNLRIERFENRSSQIQAILINSSQDCKLECKM
jgi:hypothetical protein